MHAVSGNSECHVLALIAVGDCAVADVHCCCS
ncbi:Ms4533A family Cys-rich leader peptide [Mycobacterium sp.]